jgi:hypothetical protein
MRALRNLLLLMLFSHAVMAQDDYYRSDFFEYNDKIYLNSIHTVQLYQKGYELSMPVMRLGSDDRLKLSFDDLDPELKNINYTIIHCDANWEPTNISQSEYIDGYSEDVISDYAYSFNTLQRYIHYNLDFPTDVMKIKKSGNYVLKVYRDNDPEKLVLSRRFMVYEDRILLKAQAKMATLTRYRANKQEVDFAIDASAVKVMDPFSDIKVVVTQNGRWDNAIFGLKPLYINGTELMYDYDEENTFEGGNEYRFFDIKTLRFRSERINEIIVTKDSNTVYLTTEEKRSYKRYLTNPDIDGNYVIRVQEGRDPDRDADYVNVRFVMPATEPIAGGDVYVFGKLSDWRLRPQFKLKYQADKEAYVGTIKLKQGYYNYELAFAPDGKTVPDPSEIEGSHAETENNYYVFVYLREMGTSYDQLVGYTNVNSVRRE